VCGQLWLVDVVFVTSRIILCCILSIMCLHGMSSGLLAVLVKVLQYFLLSVSEKLDSTIIVSLSLRAFLQH